MLVLLVSFFLLFSLVVPPLQCWIVEAPGDAEHPHGFRLGVTAPAGSPSDPGVLQLKYRGGPLITTESRLYIIWYGTWSSYMTTDNSKAVNIVTSFAKGLRLSDYLKINTAYYQIDPNTKQRQYASADLTYYGSCYDDYSRGNNLTVLDVQAIVAGAISPESSSCSRVLPALSNAIYFVLSSSDVDQTVTDKIVSCTSYCGWHTNTYINGLDIRFAWSGNPDRCGASCMVYMGNTINGHAGADALVSVMAHELIQFLTDPDGNGWWDDNGMENADKCAWTFGTISWTSDGRPYNIYLGGKFFLIQRDWSIVSSKCVMK